MRTVAQSDDRNVVTPTPDGPTRDNSDPSQPYVFGTDDSRDATEAPTQSHSDPSQPYVFGGGNPWDATDVAPRRALPGIDSPWLAAAVGLLITPIQLVLGSVIFIAVLAVTQNLAEITRTGQIEQAIYELASEPYGAFVLILPPELMMFVVAIGACLVFRGTIREQLGWQPSSAPWWSVALFVMATPLWGMISGYLVMHLFEERGGSMEFLDRVLIETPLGVYLLWAVFVTILPAFAEEWLYRGFLQRRLVRRWGPVAGIGVSAALFALMHGDPLHIVAVLPLGIWMGVIAWRCDAIWPAMLAHGVNNLTTVLVLRYIGSEPGADGGGDVAMMGVIVFVAVALALGAWFTAGKRRIEGLE